VAESESLAADLRQQMRQALEETDRRYADLEEQYREVKARYDARGPRDEDIDRIRQVRPREGGWVSIDPPALC